jgi:hypothetical protein
MNENNTGMLIITTLDQLFNEKPSPKNDSKEPVYDG